jgi:SAM-dependent methyltransferase
MIKLPSHLGGHKGRTHIDRGLIEFAKELGCKSMLDIGCGPGDQVYLAEKLGLKVLGIDGDFTLKRKKPELFKLHDFTTGQLDLKDNFDFVWCCEFIEHVEKKYEINWISLMKLSKYVFITYSEPGKLGHHHVNCEKLNYWIDLFNKHNFILREDLTDISKKKSTMIRDFWKENGLIFERIK